MCFTSNLAPDFVFGRISGQTAGLTRGSGSPRALEEAIDRPTDVLGALEMREVSAVFQRDQGGIGHRSRDVPSDFARDEVVISVENQSPDAEVPEPGHGS